MKVCKEILAALIISLLQLSVNADDQTADDVIECHYNNRTYQLGERIITDQSCSICTCDASWTGIVDFSNCAIIDCPFGYYRSRPHCVYNFVKDKCCPIGTCGPWHPDLDDRFIGSKRPKLSMDGVNVTITVNIEFTLFCTDRSGQATNDTPVTWHYKTLDGIEKPLNLTARYAGISGNFRSNHNGNGEERRHTWGLYFEKTAVHDSGLYTCIIHTDSPQSESSILFVETKRRKKIHDVCFSKAETTLSCLHPVESQYFFNTTSQLCQYESVQTCAPFGNRFSNLEECHQHCYLYTCQGKKEPGPCNNQFIRYFYDGNTDSCRSFMFGGCKGSIYGNNYKTLEECNAVCQKIAFESSDLESDPQICESCPWHLWVHYFKLGCRPVWVEGACCPSHFDCTESNLTSENVDSDSHTCIWNDISYSTGEEIIINSACQTCTCEKNFKGPGSPSCKAQECSPDADSILANTSCVPVYTDNECCPTENICSPSTTFAQSPPARLHPEPANLNCQFGLLKYPRGFQYKVKDQCLACSCLTPPYFTCERTKCTHKAVDHCPWAASSQCCCSTDDINDDTPRTPVSAIEIAACGNLTCSSETQCLVNPLLCRSQEECQASCQPCPTEENCTALGFKSRTLPNQCPECIEPLTPEEACEWRNCTQGPSWCMVHTRGPRTYHTLCEQPTAKKQNFLRHFEIPLCDLTCPSPCHLIDSADNSCPACQCS